MGLMGVAFSLLRPPTPPSLSLSLSMSLSLSSMSLSIYISLSLSLSSPLFLGDDDDGPTMIIAKDSLLESSIATLDAHGAKGFH